MHFRKSLIPFLDANTGMLETIVGEDPLFMDLTNFIPAYNSPCIDYGNDYSDMILKEDLNGNVRFFGEAIDLGCYEYVE